MDAGRQVTTFTLSEWQTRSAMRCCQGVTFDVSTRRAITDWDEPDYGELEDLTRGRRDAHVRPLQHEDLWIGKGRPSAPSAVLEEHMCSYES
jgi:hypothetical protein